MATSGTNITSIAKPGIGTTTGPQWATDINTSLDAVDGHDHSTSKGVRITPAGVNINADLEYNQNSATELKNVIFDSSVTAATTSYSVYQASGNLYWRNGSGTAVQITTGSAVNAGAGSISGMTSTDAGVTYADGSKTFNFFTDSGNGDYGKMAHADLLLFKYTNDNSTDTDYITIAANAAASGSSGTIYVPSENGTFLTTATSYATAAINIATSASNYPINLKPHGTGHVVIGNGGATGKLTSNGAYDLILDTNSGTNSSSIAITDAANGNINLVNNGTGEVVIGSGSASGKLTTSGAHDLVLDTNSGTNAGNITLTDGTDGAITVTPNGSGVFTIGGAWTAASQTCANLGTVTTADINGGTLAAITIDGNWTAASQTCANLGSVTTADINGGTLAAITIDGNWTAASQTCANLGTVTTADINGGTWQGTIDGSWTAASQTCANLGTVTTADINGGTWQGTIDGSWTAASQTCANLGSVTTADINGGTIDGVTSFNGIEITTTATNNIGLGSGAVDSITTGDYNVGVGTSALTSCTEGYSNTALGDGALLSTDTGHENVAVGESALRANGSGYRNHAIGYQAMITNTDGYLNIAIGRSALNFNLTGFNNTAIGSYALKNSTGNHNIALGNQCGDNITSGSDNIIIGYNVEAPSATGDDQLNIGNTIYGDLSTGDIWTKTTGKIKQKGAFMQSSTHQAMVMGG